MKPWIYRDKSFTEEDIPEGAEGFVYIMRLSINGKKRYYIGKKNFYSKKKVKKGKKELAKMTDKRGSKKKLVIKQNFENYTSSSKGKVQEILDQGGSIDERIILKICYSQRRLTYEEVRYMFKLDVLESELYLNDNILGKFYKSKLKQKSDEETV